MTEKLKLKPGDLVRWKKGEIRMVYSPKSGQYQKRNSLEIVIRVTWDETRECTFVYLLSDLVNHRDGGWYIDRFEKVE
jgi:hypothetical protein